MRLGVLLFMLVATSSARAQALVYRGCERIAEPGADGLSGIAYAGGETYWGACDTGSKLVRMDVKLGEDASIKSAKIVQMVDIKVSDPEGIALRGENAIPSGSLTLMSTICTIYADLIDASSPSFTSIRTSF